MNKTEFKLTTVGQLVRDGVLFEPLDGNHGDIHPKSEDYVSEGVPFVMASDITDSGDLDLSKTKFISEEQASKLRKGFAINGDILLSHKATIGRVAEVKTDREFVMLTPQVTYYRVKNSKELIPKYLKYYFKTPFFQNTLKSFAGSGSTRAYLGILAQHDLPIKLPQLPVQKKIAEILSAYDAKIEHNNTIIKNLEDTAQTIFNEWFVKFRFLGHKQAEFTKSENGEIPKGWRHMKVSEFCETYGGGTPDTKNAEYWENGNIDWVTPTDMTSLSTIFIDKTQKKITQRGLENSSAKILPTGSILMTSRATVGVLAISMIPVTTNQGFIVSVCKTQDESLFFFWWLKNNIRLIKDLATGSTFPEISRGVFRNIKVLIPDNKNIKLFSKAIDPLHKEIYLLHRENIALRNSRDQLLAKLI